MRAAAAATLWTVAALVLAAPATAVPGLVTVRDDLTAPIYVTAPPRDQTRLFVVQRGGLVRVIDLGTNAVATDPFIDLTGVVTLQNERGLLSMAFPPDYETSGLVYTYLTGPNGDLQIREHRRMVGDPNRTDGTSRVVWSHPHPNDNHNGGQIEFGPDGLLYLATGDGGGANDPDDNAQDLTIELGKLLRIDPRKPATGEYTVPADNPYLGAIPGVDTIWASGLRNPFRFSFDRGTGDLFMSDVGQSDFEEVTWVERVADGLGRAGNFGWDCREGDGPGPSNCDPFEPYLAPVFDYSAGSPRAITGGYLVRDPGLPTLVGRYVWADYFDGVINAFLPNDADNSNAVVAGLPTRTSLPSFGEDACGHLYVVSITRGDVERIQDGLPGACVLKPEPDGQPPPPPPPPPLVPPPVAGSQPGSGVKPVLRVAVSGRRTMLARRRLRIAVRSDMAAEVTATGRIRRAGTLRPARARVPAGERRVLTLRLRRAVARRLRAVLLRRGRAVVLLSVRARDAEGDVATARRRVTLRRR